MYIFYLDLTPPKSPDHQGMSELKEIAEDKESVNSKQNNIGMYNFLSNKGFLFICY